ncbi:MAG TPA: DinB family protein [Anaerolineales bacterium]|nr:DinB family protein [Anaerolineales bacterium]
MNLTSPTPEEYAQFYADYVQRAVQRGDVFAALYKQIDELNAAFGAMTSEQARFKPAPAEWSIKEVIGHLNDVERVFSYRLLRISRNDKTPLAGFEQEDYVREAGFDNCPLSDLISEFEFLRRANCLVVKNMTDDCTRHIGTASGVAVSARALIYMLVGHVDHHMASLHEKYLPALQ